MNSTEWPGPDATPTQVMEWVLANPGMELDPTADIAAGRGTFCPDTGSFISALLEMAEVSDRHRAAQRAHS